MKGGERIGIKQSRVGPKVRENISLIKWRRARRVILLGRAMPLRPWKSIRRKETLSVSRTRLSSRILVRSFWSRCEYHNHTHFRRIHIGHTTVWCIGRRGEGGREH